MLVGITYSFQLILRVKLTFLAHMVCCFNLIIIMLFSYTSQVSKTNEKQRFCDPEVMVLER